MGDSPFGGEGGARGLEERAGDSITQLMTIGYMEEVHPLADSADAAARSDDNKRPCGWNWEWAASLLGGSGACGDEMSARHDLLALSLPTAAWTPHATVGPPASPRLLATVAFVLLLILIAGMFKCRPSGSVQVVSRNNRVV